MDEPLVLANAGCTARFAAALVRAQGALRPIPKSSKNPHFGNTYANLDDVIEGTRPTLTANGFAVSQSCDYVMEGKGIVVRTLILHESGESLMSSVFVPLSKQDPQGAGSALTYARRYGLSTALCLATETDDDAELASRPPKRKREEPRLVLDPDGTLPPKHAAAPADGIVPVVGKWLGDPNDRPMPFGDFKGKPLGQFDTGDLERVKRWAQKKNDPALNPFIKDLVSVIAGRALGLDVDSSVERMKAAVERDDLPF